MHKKGLFASSVTMAAVCCAAVLAVTGCGDDSKSSADKTLLRLSHTQVETHPHHLASVTFKNYVESKLGDKYEVQIFPNSTLGANEKVLELIKQGAVQFLVISTNNIEAFDPTYSLFSVPYVFTSEEAFNNFISDPETLKMLNVNADKDGFYSIAAFTAGTRSFYSTTPIRSVDDLAGKKMRVMAGPTNVAMMNAFGAAATPMSFGEVYSALQQSVIDGAENNELALSDQKHGEVCKYYTYDMHQMVPDLLVASKKFYDSLSPEDRQVFDEACREAEKTAFETWNKAVADAKKTAEGMGVEFITVDVNDFRNKVLHLHQELLEANPAMRPLYEAAEKANHAVEQQ